MLLTYIIIALIAFGIKRVFFNYIGFEYKIYEEGFKLKKFFIDFAVFFVIYTFCLYLAAWLL